MPGQQSRFSMHHTIEMRKPFKTFLLIMLSLAASFYLSAQGYQALNGSVYAGSTGIFNNPAASVGSAYTWDLTVFSTQLKTSTNAVYLQNNSRLTAKDGYYSRFIHANFDVSLFNLLYKIDNSRAVNISFRGRAYNHVKSSPFNFTDSMVTSLNRLLIANRNTSYLEGFVTHAGWLEVDLNYSQVLAETNNSKLTGGITLQIMKGISGAFVKTNKISYLEQKNSTDTSYTFTNGSGSYGYSDNYDGTGSIRDFLKQTRTSFGLSLGIEYRVYNAETNATENNNLNYDWKIGVSIMDIGSNSFKASQYSAQFIDPNAAITDATAEAKLTRAKDIRAFRDSLATIFNNTSAVSGNFTVKSPTRLILNFDKSLGSHFYVNGELNINFNGLSNYTKLYTKELNLLTITPRWETAGLGAYLPVQYNTQGQFWVGAACKLGPLVIGLHNLNLLKKEPSLNGGGYLLLSFHPFNKTKIISKLDCQ